MPIKSDKTDSYVKVYNTKTNKYVVYNKQEIIKENKENIKREEEKINSEEKLYKMYNAKNNVSIKSNFNSLFVYVILISIVLIVLTKLMITNKKNKKNKEQ